MFIVPGSRPLCFSINAHHSLVSQRCPSPSWGADGRSRDSSIPKIVLPLYFLAQAHQVHHCSACSHKKVMQHPVPVCTLLERAPRKLPHLCPLTQPRNSQHFGHPWCCSLSRPCLVTRNANSLLCYSSSKYGILCTNR